MKVLIVYDSTWGNTEKIAQSIGSALGGDVKVLRAGQTGSASVESIDLLIIGSPTNGGKPTPAVQNFLNNIPESAIKGISGAAFDTRFSTKLVKIFGYAADKIAGSLKAKGVTLFLPPQGFFVKGKEGPLQDGELDRAAGWAQELIKHTNNMV